MPKRGVGGVKIRRHLKLIFLKENLRFLCDKMIPKHRLFRKQSNYSDTYKNNNNKKTSLLRAGNTPKYNFS